MLFAPLIEEGGVVWNITYTCPITHVFIHSTHSPFPPGRTYTHTSENGILRSPRGPGAYVHTYSPERNSPFPPGRTYIHTSPYGTCVSFPCSIILLRNVTSLHTSYLMTYYGLHSFSQLIYLIVKYCCRDVWCVPLHYPYL
jgi:hypothetical protein